MRSQTDTHRGITGIEVDRLAQVFLALALVALLPQRVSRFPADVRLVRVGIQSGPEVPLAPRTVGSSAEELSASPEVGASAISACEKIIARDVLHIKLPRARLSRFDDEFHSQPVQP